MKVKSMVMITCVMLFAAVTGEMVATFAKRTKPAKNYPQPPIVTPGRQPGEPPSDATILFDGKDLSQRLDDKGKAAKWKVASGYMEINRTGNIRLLRT